ncbi:conserved protein of unknown function [Nitrospira japonica]|uniref:DUF1232 domain-containing protein n=1 Tax=Nitrospira japonica TaxID=1325564 RepID=A0A1W1I9C1_9BACT|nr:YkvA family protein [Nitrospira japonica]SLM49479.1 conserved protein of unknown function [Nitrospira japonica]
MFGQYGGRAGRYLRDKERLQRLIGEALSMARARGGAIWTDIQLLTRLLKAWMNGAYHGVSAQTLVAIVAALIYFINPFDAVPDFIPGLGYIDDAALIAWLLKSLAGDLDQFKNWEDRNGSAESPQETA